MTTYGLTPPRGWSLKPYPLSMLKSILPCAWRSATRSNTSAQSVFGQLKGIFAEREALIWELLAEIYNVQYPDTAEDVSLDHAVALTGHKRLAATYSRIIGVVLSGMAGTVVTIDAVFSVDGNPDARFSPQQSVTIGAGGTVEVDCLCLETGPVEGNCRHLDQYRYGPSAGLSGVTNPNAATAGRDLETDAELRIRRKCQPAVLQVRAYGCHQERYPGP